MATSGDILLTIREDFYMATDSRNRAGQIKRSSALDAKSSFRDDGH